MTNSEVTFSIKRIAFDEGYQPSTTTRLTTNFANLARGTDRQQNLRNVFQMINNRFSRLIEWDNPTGDRYRVSLEIISADLLLAAAPGQSFPLIEMLSSTIVDQHSGTRMAGITGNNFSSHIRDYDFSVLLPKHRASQPDTPEPAGFGDVHGKLFRHFIASPSYRQIAGKPPVICISVSTSRRYHRTANMHPILGHEYLSDAQSSTDAYFAKMGLSVRYFMPVGSTAPFAFYHSGDLLNEYSNIELASTVATMDSFQRVYRPELYNANAMAGEVYAPSLAHNDFSRTQIIYDRDERSHLAIEQGQFTDANLIQPYGATLSDWAANFRD